MKKLSQAQKNWLTESKNYITDLTECVNDSKNVIASCELDKKIAERRIAYNKQRIEYLKKQIALTEKTASDYKKSLK